MHVARLVAAAALAAGAAVTAPVHAASFASGYCSLVATSQSAVSNSRRHDADVLCSPWYGGNPAQLADPTAEICAQAQVEPAYMAAPPSQAAGRCWLAATGVFGDVSFTSIGGGALHLCVRVSWVANGVPYTHHYDRDRYAANGYQCEPVQPVPGTAYTHAQVVSTPLP